MTGPLRLSHRVERQSDGSRRVIVAGEGGSESLGSELTWTQTSRAALRPELEELTFVTERGPLRGVLHPASGSPRGAHATGAVICVGGAGDGVNGPAQGLYPALCRTLQDHGYAGLRLTYRRANDLPECVVDTLLGIAFLLDERIERIALVGHSFGGAVVITAGVLSSSVAGVAALSSQTFGTQLVPHLAPRPLLLMHGTDDEILPARCSELIHAAAGEPKELILLPGTRHGLDEAREIVLATLTRTITAWLRPEFA